MRGIVLYYYYLLFSVSCLICFMFARICRGRIKILLGRPHVFRVLYSMLNLAPLTWPAGLAQSEPKLNLVVFVRQNLTVVLDAELEVGGKLDAEPKVVRGTTTV